MIITGVCGCYVFPKKANMFTEAEHIERITERFQQKLYDMPKDDGITVESFSVYPLYNQNEELSMFLVEIEPFGFTFVSLRDENYDLLSCSNGTTSMYKVSDFYGVDTWSPYIVDKTSSQPDPDNEKIFILDEKGERIYYKKSPYYVTGNIDKRKYLIETQGSEYICAIKEDGEFINLISKESFTVENVNEYELSQTQSTIHIFILHLNSYDL
jgi:hypothetical protein